jgi:Flp pilus assembly protein TadG
VTREVARRWRHLLDRPERGAGGESLELVIITPAVVLVILVCIALGRFSLGTSKVDQAAQVAARAAALQHDPTTARDAARSEATASLAESGSTCRDLRIVLDDTGFNVPAGAPATVGVTVRCTVDWSDLTLPGWPGTRDVEATATSPLDVTAERLG